MRDVAAELKELRLYGMAARGRSRSMATGWADSRPHAG
jgi:hypothetical protein